MLKKKIALVTSIILIIATLAVMVSAAPFVNSVMTAKISAAEAENIALEKAGLTRESVRFERTEIDSERGKLVWEVEFHKGNKEYSFEIDAATGEVLREETEGERRPSAPLVTDPPATDPPATNPPVTEPPVTDPLATDPPATVPPNENPASAELTREQAIEIALSDAGLTREQIRELEVERDYERGTLVYEIDFEHGRKEYSYDIRISDGKIITRDVEIDD